MAITSAPAPIVRGRDAELAMLGEHLDRVRSGSGAVILVEGGAGMGKTRLIEEAVTIARRLSSGSGTTPLSRAKAWSSWLL